MPGLPVGAEHATDDAPPVTLHDNATVLRGVVVPDCGHFIVEEAPEACMAELRPFLAERCGPAEVNGTALVSG